MKTIPNLDFVAPHKRDEIIKRIEVIEQFLEQRGLHAARRSAATLGMGLVNFYALARAWEETRSIVNLGMDAGLRADHNVIGDSQIEIIAQAIDEMPGAILERIAERALEIGRHRKVDMPSAPTVVIHIARGTVGRLPTGSRAEGADLIVEHCVVDVGVADAITGAGMMPIATIVTAVRDPHVIGLTLATQAPSAAGTAKALAEALKNLRPDGSEKRPLVVYIQGLTGKDWDALRRAVRSCGVIVNEYTVPSVSPPNAILRLLGRRIKRIQIKARLGRRPFSARPAGMATGAMPLTLAEAEAFLRARWMGPDDNPVSLPTDVEQLERTALALSSIGN